MAEQDERESSGELARLESPTTVYGRYSSEELCRKLGVGEPRPLCVGRDARYRLERRLGMGSMGEVYLAHDTFLDRWVGLKVVASRHHNSPQLRRRLVREAQLLAQVEHPNVLALYECEDSSSGELFVTMAYVDGPSLAQWQRGRSPRELISVYVRAGQGLAAAHEQGVIHRDFKASNVLVDLGKDRVFVADFGLARIASGEDEDTDDDVVRAGASASESSLGKLVGTRPYIAPELIAGEGASPASDLYAFCVALWEGLTGTHPFGTGLREPGALLPARSEPMPRWLYRALAKGLAEDPRARFPTVAALLTVLERGLGRTRRLGGTLLVFLLGVSALGWELAREDTAPPSCSETTQASLAQVWNPSERARVAELLGAFDERGMESESFALTVLDESARQWRAVTIESCEALVQAPHSYRALNQGACLDARLEHFGDTLRELERRGPSSGSVIHELLEPLSRVEARCTFPGPILHARARRSLAQVRFAVIQRDHERGLELAQAAVEDTLNYAERCLSSVESSVERGEAYYQRAAIHAAREDPRAVLEDLARADIESNACNHNELLARSYIKRAQVLALEFGDAGAARAELDAGVARYERLGYPWPAAVEISEARAFIALAEDKPDAAIVAYEAAIATLGSELSTQALVAKFEADIGAARQMLGDYEGAAEAYQRADAHVSDALGPEHPESRARRAQIVLNLAIMASEQGELERARGLLEQLEGFDEPGLMLKARSTLLNILLGDPERTEQARDEALALLAWLEVVEHLPLEGQAEAYTLVGQVLASQDEARGLEALRHALELWGQLPSAGEARDICQLAFIESSLSFGEDEQARRLLGDLLTRVDEQTNPALREAVQGVVERLASEPTQREGARR